MIVRSIAEANLKYIENQATLLEPNSVLVAVVARLLDVPCGQNALVQLPARSTVSARVVSQRSYSTVLKNLMPLACVPVLVPIRFLNQQMCPIETARVVTQMADLKQLVPRRHPSQLISPIEGDQREVMQVELCYANTRVCVPFHP